MGRDIVVPIAIVAGVLGMLAVYVFATRGGRSTRSRERAEREGLLGPAGRRHAEQRADPEWVEQSRPADTNPIVDVLGHTIADKGRAQRPEG